MTATTRLIAVAVLTIVASPGIAQPGVVGSDTRVGYTLPVPVGPGEPVVRTVDVTYDWDAGAVNPEPTEVELRANATFTPLAPWAQVAIQPETLTFQPDGTDGQSTKTANLSVNVGLEAPSGVPATVNVIAEAQQNGVIAASEGSTAQELVGALRPDVQVRVPEVVDPNEQDAFDVEVRSAANGPLAIRIVNVSAGGVSIDVPDPVVVGPGGQLRDLADELPVAEDRRDDYRAPPERTLTVGVEGSGSSTLTFDVAFGPAGSETTIDALTQSIRVAASGGLLVPAIAAVLSAGAVAVGYLWLRDGASGPIVEPGTHPEEE